MKKYSNNIRAIGCFLAIFIFAFSTGFFVSKNQTLKNFIKNSFKSIYDIRKISYKNYKKGLNSSPEILELIIPKKSYQILLNSKQNAIKNGILKDNLKVYVPAKIIYNKDTINVELRLKGDYSDHWSGDKTSYRIKLKKGKEIFDLRTFSVQNPNTRRYLSEWYFHKILEEVQLIFLKNKYIEIIENKKHKGVYHLEEAFDKKVLINSGRINGPILKFDESILIDKNIVNDLNTFNENELFLMARIDVFKSNKTLKDSILNNQYIHGKSLINKLRFNKTELDKVIDIDKAAKLFAIADITGGHHGLRWKNVRFYYNPISKRLELIGFDSGSGVYITDIYYNLWKENKINEYSVCRVWKDLFFNNNLFIIKYFKYLEIYSSEDFLNKFHENIKTEMNENLSYIYKEKLNYDHNLDLYYSNARLVQQKIKDFKISQNIKPNNYYIEVKAGKQIEYGSKEISLKIKNKSIKPIKIIGIFEYTNKISDTKTILFPEKDNNFNFSDYKFNLNQMIDSTHIKLKITNNMWVFKKLKLGYKFQGSNDTIYSVIERYYKKIN